MSLADAVLTALRGFAGEVSTWTNQGSLISIQTHIAQIESAAAEDVHAGETAAKAVLGDLYAAFHGHAPAEPAAPAAVTEPSADAPVAPVAEPTPATVDPTTAPSTTTEDSSAPSSTPSASTDAPAV